MSPDDLLSRLLESLRVGLAVVGADGRLTYANARARRLLLRVASGPAGWPDLRGIVARAWTEEHGGLPLRLDGGDGGVVLAVAQPLAETGEADGHAPGHCPGRCALVVLIDPAERPAPGGRILVELFGLSPTETQVALALARGERLEDIATSHEVSRETVRTQLKAVLQKMGAARQTDVISLAQRLALVA